MGNNSINITKQLSLTSNNIIAKTNAHGKADPRLGLAQKCVKSDNATPYFRPMRLKSITCQTYVIKLSVTCCLFMVTGFIYQ